MITNNNNRWHMKPSIVKIFLCSGMAFFASSAFALPSSCDKNSCINIKEPEFSIYVAGIKAASKQVDNFKAAIKDVEKEISDLTNSTNNKISLLLERRAALSDSFAAALIDREIDNLKKDYGIVSGQLVFKKDVLISDLMYAESEVSRHVSSMNDALRNSNSAVPDDSFVDKDGNFVGEIPNVSDFGSDSGDIAGYNAAHIQRIAEERAGKKISKEEQAQIDALRVLHNARVTKEINSREGKK